MPDTTIVIVGGGAAGLSAAGALKQRGLDAIILEKSRRVGDVWAQRYDRLHLHTVFSSLAHYPIPPNYPKYPSKDQYAQYLRDYARHFGLNAIAGCQATKVRLVADGPSPTWLVESTCGTWRCRVVVIAMGQYGTPLVPDWPGRELYQGALSHSATYKNASGYEGKRVLVVGIGNSGAEIATELAERGTAFVAISIRTPPPIVPRDPFGMPVQRTGIILSLLPPRLADRLGRLTARLVLGDLTRYGLSEAAWWPYTAHSVPVIDVGFVREVKRGRIQIRPNVARLTHDGVVYVDGQAEAFDAVIAATGYKTGLDQVVDVPGALDAQGFPSERSGRPTGCPGLYFMGYTHSLRGHLFEANRDSRRLARLIEVYLSR